MFDDRRTIRLPDFDLKHLQHYKSNSAMFSSLPLKTPHPKTSAFHPATDEKSIVRAIMRKKEVTWALSPCHFLSVAFKSKLTAPHKLDLLLH